MPANQSSGPSASDAVLRRRFVRAAALAAGLWYWHASRVADWTLETGVNSHLAEPPARRIVRGRFSLRVNLPANFRTTVTYLMPVDAAGRPLPGASDMVFYGPVTGGAWRKPPNRPIHFYFAEQLGMTIFSLTIQKEAYRIAGTADSYGQPDPAWHRVILECQELIARRHRLALRPLLAWGRSSGATLAAGLALHFPERIDAVTGCGGAVTARPTGAVPPPGCS